MGIDASGVLVKESLVDPEVLDTVTVVQTKVAKVANVVGEQSPAWTLVYFKVDPANADFVAAKFSHSLLPDKWYVNFSVHNSVYVVYPTRIFKYPIGDSVRRLQARLFGSRMGIPDEQLDWEE